jgi:hypothetical protein
MNGSSEILTRNLFRQFRCRTAFSQTANRRKLDSFGVIRLLGSVRLAVRLPTECKCICRMPALKAISA